MFVQECCCSVLAINLYRYQGANGRKAKASSGLEFNGEEVVGSSVHDGVQHGLIDLGRLDQTTVACASLHRLRETNEEPKTVLLCSVVGSHCQSIAVNCHSQSDVSSPDQVTLCPDGNAPPLAGTTDVLLTHDASDVIHDPPDSGSEGLKLTRSASCARAEPSPTPSTHIVA